MSKYFSSLNSKLELLSGDATSPPLTFDGDIDDGFYSDTNLLGFTINGESILSMNKLANNTELKIGTTNIGGTLLGAGNYINFAGTSGDSQNQNN
jgi:hypothetical protein